jgi:membrane protein implicated in regulation of membrane protease activity
MKLAEGIRKHGFRSWHERELLLTFGWLALALVFAVVAFGALERLLGGAAWPLMVRSVVVMLAASAALFVTLRRFARGMARTQSTASQALCPSCGEFGRLAIVNEDRNGQWVKVRCRGCSHEWVIEDA